MAQNAEIGRNKRAKLFWSDANRHEVDKLKGNEYMQLEYKTQRGERKG